jgi:hypothetical protein
VVGCTIGSRGEEPGERKTVIRGDDVDDDDDDEVTTKKYIHIYDTSKKHLNVLDIFSP